MRKEFKKSVGESDYLTFDYDQIHEISKLEEVLAYLKEQGATHFNLYAEKDYDGYVESYEFNGMEITYETDDAMKSRLESEAKELTRKEEELKQKTKENELVLLAKLKQKYE